MMTALETNLTKQAQWTLWQLVDSAFPSGGFAHSNGLESAWQHGTIPDINALISFLKNSLVGLCKSQLPFAFAAHQSPPSLTELDCALDFFLSNHVSNRARRRQGHAFVTAVTKIFGLQELDHLFQHIQEGEAGHFTVYFAVTTRTLKLDSVQMGELFLFIALKNYLSAAVRLGIVGPLYSQSILYRLSPLLEKMTLDHSHLNFQNAVQTAPVLDILQGTQDRLYSRLFQS